MSQTIKASSSAMKICGLGNSASADGFLPSSTTVCSQTTQGIRHSYSISQAEAGPAGGEQEKTGRTEGPVSGGHGVSPHFFRQHRLEKSAVLTPMPCRH